MAFTLPHFNCITIISILLSFSFPLVPVSADDSSSTECQYPCLPAPVVPVTYCPPPPPPPLPLSPVTGYWSYPPPPPSEYYPYYSPPNKYNMNPSPPPPDPMLPWFPWYYQHKGPSVSKGNCVFSQGSLGGSNVVLLGIVAVLMIL
ncbi:hypothetical protein FCM35_KLT02293 [Carex littledalei]|uniref:Uncharacterized protein n=1 Tax=Carex littledalei TaxID=544730 RepID=A0A833R3Q5_9POAL|nr:hypothetical protein FCM35_KLT02293 [Carex littledalei]